MINIFKLSKQQQLSFVLDQTIEVLRSEGFLCFFITVNLDVENNADIAKTKWNDFSSNFDKIIQTNIVTWAFTFISMEISENNLLHTHAIVIIKNITNYPYNICNNLKILLRMTGYLDIKVNFLKDFIDTKRAFIYIYKDSSQSNFKNNVYFNIKQQQLISKLLDELDNQNFESIQNGYTYFLHDLKFIKLNIKFKKIFDVIINIKGLVYKEKHNEKDINFDFILNLYVFYCLLNDIREYNNHFIIKITESLISYKIWCDKKKLILKWNEIIEFYLSYFKDYISNYNLYELKKNNLFLDQLNDKLIKLPLLIDMKINISFIFIEFSDGIYNLKENIFFRKSNVKKNYFLNSGTLKYYEYSFKNLKLPKIWLNNIIKVLENDEKNIIDLLMHLGVIFSNNYDFIKKKRVLFILGESNTYKTTLIANIFFEFFGIENIALMTQSKNFPFQNFDNKLIAVLDEFKYYEALHPEYLKIFENRDAIIEKKFENAVVINPVHIILLSNENFIKNQEDITKQNALVNRINTFIFKKQILDDIELKNIKKENIEIIVFLCKLYNELICNTKDKRKHKIKNYINEKFDKNNLIEN